MTDALETKSPMRRAGEAVGLLVCIVVKGFLFGCGALLAIAVFGLPQ